MSKATKIGVITRTSPYGNIHQIIDGYAHAKTLRGVLSQIADVLDGYCKREADAIRWELEQVVKCHKMGRTDIMTYENVLYDNTDPRMGGTPFDQFIKVEQIDDGLWYFHTGVILD